MGRKPRLTVTFATSLEENIELVRVKLKIGTTLEGQTFYPQLY